MIKDRVGQRIGRLLVIELAGTDARHAALWRCLCDCGNYTVVPSSNLNEQHTRSCGCLGLERRVAAMRAKNQTHGLSPRKYKPYSTYTVWANMLDRCRRITNPAYKNYGGRGITVCARWVKFENFLADMGERPKGLTLDRKNNDKGYSKRNCRWATWVEQQNNRRPRRPKKHVA